MNAINFNQELKDLEGNVINGYKECCIIKEDKTFVKQGEDYLIVRIPDKALTAKAMVITALMTPEKQEGVATDSGEKLLLKYRLAQRISKTEGAIKLKSEEATLIKERLAKIATPLIYGILHDIIEGEEIEDLEEEKPKPTRVKK